MEVKALSIYGRAILKQQPVTCLLPVPVMVYFILVDMESARQNLVMFFILAAGSFDPRERTLDFPIFICYIT